MYLYDIFVSLLSRFLVSFVYSPLGYTFAIIENEFGAIPVDDQLLLGSKENRSVFIEEHLEVVNGCVWYEKKRKEKKRKEMKRKQAMIRFFFVRLVTVF